METDKAAAALRVAELLRAAREAADMTKYEAAAEAGMSEGRWRQLEKGVEKRAGVESPASAPPVTLARMARAVGLEPSQLLEAAGVTLSEDEVTEELTKATYHRKVKATSIDVSDLTPEQVAMVEGIIIGLRHNK
ncbi:helix-turn-helix domain-containing protein [Rhodococcus opacus]|uniref:helix-turn-helix domain-containing protein n=1 Tax=Rhodococcus opacus TaxID=37919 RepID=UPI001C49208B|nr:helix-turn-helix transcriptional regulator [Rhodococcus opacus]MBV6758422.1 helix-turn-helix domain-containing protein [Rhodococcus opacus]